MSLQQIYDMYNKFRILKHDHYQITEATETNIQVLAKIYEYNVITKKQTYLWLKTGLSPKKFTFYITKSLQKTISSTLPTNTNLSKVMSM